MTIELNGHRVQFASGGQIFVDDKIIALGIRNSGGRHVTYHRVNETDATAKLAGQRFGRPGSYEKSLAEQIVAALFK